MSGNQSEGQVGPSRPGEEQEFLAANQDVLEDALSYAVSNVIQTRAGGKNGAHENTVSGVVVCRAQFQFKKCEKEIATSLREAGLLIGFLTFG